MKTLESHKNIISIDQALELQEETYLDLYAKYINSFVVRTIEPFQLSRKYVRAEGIYLWDQQGNTYRDFFNGFGCLNLGHNHPNILNALSKILDQHAPMIHQLVPSSLEAALAHNLAMLLPNALQVSYFLNSGSEAIEASMKLARGYTGRNHLLSTYNSYHGRTLGALSLTGIDQYRAPFRPLLPFVKHIPFGDSEQMEEQLKTNRYGAVYLEPIQGQGGINVPPEDYLPRVRELCNRHGTLLVLDEVQCGMGRTGKMFAFEHYNVVPDILVVSKSLGGGIMPLSACITTKKIWDKVYGSFKKFLLHGSTFSGNAMACASGIATISTMLEEEICENCTIQGKYFLSKLMELKDKHKVISQIKGKGLMIGVTFDLSDSNLLSHLSQLLINSISAKIVTSHVASLLLNEFRIIVPPSLTDEYLLRVYPPLNVTKDEIDYFISSFDKVCESLSTYTYILRKTLRRFGKYYASGNSNR